MQFNGKSPNCASCTISLDAKDPKPGVSTTIGVDISQNLLYNVIVEIELHSIVISTRLLTVNEQEFRRLQTSDSELMPSKLAGQRDKSA